MKYWYWIAIVALLFLVALLLSNIALAQEPEITTDVATDVTSDSATLNGNLTSLGNASSLNVWFDYATDAFYTSNAGNYSTSTTSQAMFTAGPFNSPVSSLSGSTTYHFRAVAEGNSTVYGNDMIFTTGTVPPMIITNAASDVTIDSATLNGNLTSLGTALSVQVSFEWGLTSGYGSETPAQTMTATGPFIANFTGLPSGTTYYFRAKAVGDGTSYGTDETFTTGTTPPTVVTTGASNVTSDSATLNGNLTSLGTASSVQVSFEWGLTTSYGNETTSAQLTDMASFANTINGLSPGTTYYFRAKAVGDGTSYGNDTSFTTSTAPIVATTSASNLTDVSATMNGELINLGNATSVDLYFEWGLTASYGNETSHQTMTTAGPFSSELGNLSAGTTYHFRAVAGGNGTSYGNDIAFTTDDTVNLQGWGWCTDHNQVVAVTFDGHTTMVERGNASNSYSMHTVGNLTLPGPYNETISLDMYGNRARLLFYLRQEATGKSVNFNGTWIVNDAGNETYIGMTGSIGLPNPQGDALKTARICFVVLRTPDVAVQLTQPGSFTEDLDSMLTRFVKLVDSTLTSLIGTGFAGILSSILGKIAVLLAHIRALGIPYIS
jgi:hypothetical protein